MSTHSQPFHVVIAGGGLAGLESMMALRVLAGGMHITLLAPNRDFHYRPMAVAEPFSVAEVRHIALVAIAHDFGARHLTDALAGVEATEQRIITRSDAEIGYDALVIATGTEIRPAFEGVITIDDRSLGATLRGLVQDVEEGYTSEIAFVAPAQGFWPLPLYELALQTAHRAYDMNAKVDISIVSPERAPLDVFGVSVSDELTKLLRDAAITFHGSSFATLTRGELTLQPSGVRLRPGRIVALPLLEGPKITGVPSDPHGFIPITDDGAMRGLDGVYAAGDATSFPIKHGGLAAQQADVVAAAIAARAGVAADPQPRPPVLRGMLLTGKQSRFLEAEIIDGRALNSIVSDVCPWDPPTKIVARHRAVPSPRRSALTQRMTTHRPIGSGHVARGVLSH
jgi:sulfide:quinone oxidoreductase